MIYIITFQNKQDYIDLNQFALLKTNNAFSYTFHSNYVLIQDKTKSSDGVNLEYKSFLVEQLNILKESRTKLATLNEADTILKQLINMIESINSFNLEYFITISSILGIFFSKA